MHHAAALKRKERVCNECFNVGITALAETETGFMAESVK